MDGVLIDRCYHVHSWINAFAHYGISVNEKDLYMLKGHPFKDTIVKIFKKNGRDIDETFKEEVHLLKYKLLSDVYEFKLMMV